MVRLTDNPSLRDASCCRVEVVNGAAGLRAEVFCSSEATTKPPRSRPAAKVFTEA